MTSGSLLLALVCVPLPEPIRKFAWLHLVAGIEHSGDSLFRPSMRFGTFGLLCYKTALGELPMKVFCKLLFIITLQSSCAQLLAAEETDIVGMWKSEFSIQGRTVAFELEILSGPNGLTGTFTGPRASNPLEKAKFEGNTLSFKHPLNESFIILTFSESGLNGSLSTQAGDMPLAFRKVN